MDTADVMRTFVVTVHPASTLTDVEELLLETGFAMVPVVTGSRLVGVVGLDDLPLAGGPDTVERVMTTAVVSAGPRTSLEDLVQLLRVTGLSGVPVLEGGALVGVVTRRDVADAWSRSPHPARSGAEPVTAGRVLFGVTG